MGRSVLIDLNVRQKKVNEYQVPRADPFTRTDPFMSSRKHQVPRTDPFIGAQMRLSQVEYAPKTDTAGILGFYMGKNTPERKDYIMDSLVVPVED